MSLSLFTTGQKVAGIGIFAMAISFIFYLAGCSRIVYWPGCAEYRNIPVIPWLILPFLFSGGALFLIGMIIHYLRKPDLSSESGVDNP